MRSYKKVPYDLRPAKQAERRMLIDSLQQLSQAGYPIRDYRYVGFGSIFFYDYILFHKLLGIQDMVSIEGETKDEDRVEFNKPYNFINVEMALSTDILLNLSRDIPHLLWLDYDEPLQSIQAEDISLACKLLHPGSILLITLDAEEPDETDPTPNGTYKYFKDEVGTQIGLMDAPDFTQELLPYTCTKMVNNIIQNSLRGRPDVKFYQLFSFEYSDSHKMVTLGGMLGIKGDQKKIKASGIYDNVYIQKDIREKPFEINVPILTRKERVCLDSLIPLDKNQLKLPFHLSDEDIERYIRIYRFLPAYGELLV